MSNLNRIWLARLGFSLLLLTVTLLVSALWQSYYPLWVVGIIWGILGYKILTVEGRELLKDKKLIKIGLSVVVIAIALALITINLVLPVYFYNNAQANIDNGNYRKAISSLKTVGDYRDSQAKMAEIATLAYAQGDLSAAVYAWGVLGEYKRIHQELRKYDPVLSTSGSHTLALRTDGTVAAIYTGFDDSGEYDVADWTDIIAVSLGADHAVGLKADGSVVATGSNHYGQCDVADWAEISSVVATIDSRTIGIKTDGTVVQAGGYYSYSLVPDWQDIIAVSANQNHIVGLKANGTVVADGTEGDGKCAVSHWTEVVEIATGSRLTVGLKDDGTVVAAGFGQEEISNWTDIITISAQGDVIVGLQSDGDLMLSQGHLGSGFAGVDLRSAEWSEIVAFSVGTNLIGVRIDGTVVEFGIHRIAEQTYVRYWSEILVVSTGYKHTVGLKADGTLQVLGHSEISSLPNIGLPSGDIP